MLRATASADTAEGAAALLPPLLAQVQELLGDVIYAIEEDDRGSLAKSAVEAMKALGWTCATCESLTGGMIVSAMVGVPGASSVVRGGLVTYQTDTKTLLAGVPAEVIAQYDVVSAEVAREMARRTREKLGVDIAVSATGLAGPDGGTAEKPVGTVFVGVATREKVWALPLALTGNRERIRTLTMKHALNALLRTASNNIPR